MHVFFFTLFLLTFRSCFPYPSMTTFLTIVLFFNVSPVMPQHVLLSLSLTQYGPCCRKKALTSLSATLITHHVSSMLTDLPLHLSEFPAVPICLRGQWVPCFSRPLLGTGSLDTGRLWGLFP